MKYILSVTLLILANVNGFSQQSKKNILPDSLAVWELRKIAHPLALDTNQVKYFLGASKNHLDELNMIKTKYPNDSSRIIAIRETEKRYMTLIKSILNKEQYEKYLAMREANKSKFIRNQSKGEAKVKLFDTNQ